MIHEKLIEKYIQDNLSQEEQIAFDKLLKNDAVFKKEVELHTNLKNVIKKEDADNFRHLVSDIENKAKIPLKKYVNTKWLVAASIVLLFGLGYFSSLSNQPSTNELFTDYFEPYRNVIQPIERGNTQENEKTMAFIAYEKSEYEKAIKLFSKLYANTKESYYLFYKANSLLKLEKAKEAIPLLLEHLKTKDTLTEKTHWYLALAYLKLNEKSNAKKALKKVINNGVYKTKEAKELLKKFD